MIELTIGDAFFQATPLFFFEYKRAVEIFADIDRHGLADNMPGILATICRSGAKVTAAQISGALTPAEIMKSVGLLMGNASGVEKLN